MSRIVLIRQGSGSPDVLPLEAWHALYGAQVHAAPGEPLALRLRELGVSVSDVAEASHEALVAAATTGEPASGRRAAGPELRLLAHVHERTSPGASALAGRLAALAGDHHEIALIVPQADADAVVKAVMERALEGDVEVEVVMGRVPTGHELLDLVKTMHRLRAPGGCPWDREQTHASLAKYLLDETYELLEAIDSGDTTHLAEELGDLLLQVVFHAEIAAEDGSFDIDDVAHGLVTKLVTRHPHVFGDVAVAGAADVVANWEAIKDVEKGRTSVLEGVPEALPALAYAQKLLKRAARASLPPTGEPAAAAPSDERDMAPVSDAARALVAVSDEASLGEALMAIVAAARAEGLDAEAALRRAARRFRDRLARAERLAADRGTTLAALSDAERASTWEQAGE